MPYKPIESVLGDLHTVALVSMDGSIDWCCLPQFDSPSIFAAILDERKGGFFKIASLYKVQHKQMYLPDSNVLLTRAAARRRTRSFVSCGPCAEPCFRLECQPACDYARRPHRVTMEGPDFPRKQLENGVVQKGENVRPRNAQAVQSRSPGLSGDFPISRLP
jgi:hypothetical protein